jgi:hypothetical protein
MIVRRISYTEKPGSDMMEWVYANSQKIRAVDGMRKAEFLKSKTTPGEWAAFMYFNSQKDLDIYKKSGPYKAILKSMADYVDMNKPIKDEVFECLEV